jgi:hypothetical protein
VITHPHRTFGPRTYSATSLFPNSTLAINESPTWRNRILQACINCLAGLAAQLNRLKSKPKEKQNG